MDATRALKAASAETAEIIGRIDAKVRDKLLKRARRHGLDESEAIKHVEAWKHAARKTKRMELGQ